MRGSPATIRDVARRADVSTATVSRVLNGDPRVAEGTRAKVRVAIDELGYTMNQVARSLKTRSTRSIGLVAPDFASDFFMLLADSLDRELAIHGYGLIVCSSRDSPEEERKRLRLLAERLVEGIIMIPASGHGRHIRDALGDIPIVLIDRLCPGLRADAVLTDNEAGARAAVAALLEAGHRRIGFVGGDPEVSTSRERYKGYLDALHEKGIEPEPDTVAFTGTTIEAGRRAMEGLMSGPKPPGAYFVVNAHAHVGATNYLVEAGLRPENGPVLAAFDEMPYSPLLGFCRWSVEQPVAAMGSMACGVLLERIRGVTPARPELVRLPVRLVSRPLAPARGVRSGSAQFSQEVRNG